MSLREHFSGPIGLIDDQNGSSSKRYVVAATAASQVGLPVKLLGSRLFVMRVWLVMRLPYTHAAARRQ